jgi:hypothetical protein
MPIVDDFKERKMVKLVSSDPGFAMDSGLCVYQRSFLEILPQCPNEYIFILQQAINMGWIRLGAYVPEEQYTWEKLKGITK